MQTLRQFLIDEYHGFHQYDNPLWYAMNATDPIEAHLILEIWARMFDRDQNGLLDAVYATRDDCLVTLTTEHKALLLDLYNELKKPSEELIQRLVDRSHYRYLSLQSSGKLIPSPTMFYYSTPNRYWLDKKEITRAEAEAHNAATRR